MTDSEKVLEVKKQEVPLEEGTELNP